MGKFDFEHLQSQCCARFSVPVSREHGVARLLVELAELSAEAETMIEQQEEGDRAQIACGAGCDDCCVVNVSITLLEGIAIARYVRRMEDDVATQVSLRLDRLWSAVRGLEDDERLVVRRKCAFLDECGFCLIYPVRPLFCRSISSIDVEQCRAAVTGPVFDEVKPVIMHQFQLQLYKTLFAGVASGLEQAGLDGRSFQLCGLVRYLLTHPDREVASLFEGSLSWDALYA